MGAKAFLEALVESYRDGAKASTGYNMPFLKNYAKPAFPIISEDPELKPLEQDAEYHSTTGFPGPLTPAGDEVYLGRANQSPPRGRGSGSTE